MKNKQDSLEVFVANLVMEKGLANLDEETLAQIKADLLDRVEDRINATIVASIPSDKMEYFEKMIERSETADIQDFCARNIPGLDSILAKELVEFRKTYLNLE